MTISALTGPILAVRENPTGTAPGSNPQSGPSMFDAGLGLLDFRTPFTYLEGAGEQVKCYGFLGGSYCAIDQVPSAIADNNIAASQSPAAAALTLVSTTAAGITVGVSVYSPTSNAQVTGLLAIDGAFGALASGTAGTINIYDPTKAISRAVRITSGGNDSGITFLVVGYDLYGYRMTETITGANAGIATGKKAFKYIQSITPSGAAAGTVKVGTADIIGFPIRADFFAYTGITYNNTVIIASTGFTGAVTTSPATTTTGDVRGTYALQSASDGTKRIKVFIIPSPAVMINTTNSSTFTGPYGVTQV